MQHKKLILTGIFLYTVVQFRSFYMYGLISKQHLDDIITDVTNTLGDGSNHTAHLLLKETAMAETHYGDTPDTHLFSGYGLFQFDKPGFDDVVQRTSQRNKDLIKKVYDIDIDQVSLLALQWSPLLSTIFARLFYLLKPGTIPDTLEGRAQYWKHYYNTKLGAGTVEHYIKANL